MDSQKTSVLFVCLGNICRSPIAEAVFTKLVNDLGVSDKWEIDSAAIIDYHTGKNPDRRAQKCMKDHDVPMNHRARPIVAADFNKFDYIFGMDDDNMRDLTGIAPENCSAKIELLGMYHPENPGVIIRDPYYSTGSIVIVKNFDITKNLNVTDSNAAGHRQMAVLELYSDSTITLRNETNFEPLWRCAEGNYDDASYNQR